MTDKVRLLLTQALSLLDPMEPVPVEDHDALVAKRNLPHPTVEELKRKVVLLTEEKEHYRLSYISALADKTRLYDRIQLDAQTTTEPTPTHTKRDGDGMLAMAFCYKCGGSSITKCACPSGVWVSD